MVITYSTDRGLNWSAPEFVTDRYDSTIAFKAGALLPNGDYCVNYEVMSPGNINSTAFLRVYFRKRNSVISNVEELNSHIPNSFQLYQNYPNPFNPNTKIIWQSPVGSHQTLKVYDVLGNEIATLADEYRNAGRYEINFSSSDLVSGIYFYRLTAGAFIETKKMILMK
ncbi:MAG: T9SS type A sorting domain-containing protein [Ignavibacteriaceae bacterium]|nr:T9SS type A sorting domain-containing protein [Ignavibacteriaceae bacterium]